MEAKAAFTALSEPNLRAEYDRKRKVSELNHIKASPHHRTDDVKYECNVSGNEGI